MSTLPEIASTPKHPSALDHTRWAAAGASPRLLHVDGLRAVAALAVALFHFYGYLPYLSAALPKSVNEVVKHGYLGVNVFFVLSGFVISHSLAGVTYSPGFIGRFALRRSLRLDPPYWAAIVLSAVSLSRAPSLDPARLAPRTLLAHFTYLQNILGYPNLLDVFWTLCIEIQLYLAFVVLAWLASARTRERSRRREGVFVLSMLLSLSLAFFQTAQSWIAWFPIYWYMFALGVFTRWALDDLRSRRWFGVFVLLTVARSIYFHGPGPAVCAATAVLLYAAPYVPLIARAMGCRPLVNLGRISYSFYLLHALAGGAILSAILQHRTSSLTLDILAFLAALLASLAFAWIFWWSVERPSLALSRRIKLPARDPEAVTSPRCP